MDINASRNLHNMRDMFGDGSIDALLDRLSALASDDPELDAKVEQERLTREAMQQAQEEFHLLLASGFPKMAVLALDRVNDAESPWKAARDRLAALARKSGAIIALHGPCGTGKTVMATSLARSLVRLGRSVKYVKAYDYCLDLRESKRENDIARAFKRPTYLVIDEFHELKRSDFSQYSVDRLIDSRHQDGKITVVISNLIGEDVEPSLGPSITSRMHMTGGAIPCEWQSYREINYNLRE